MVFLNDYESYLSIEVEKWFNCFPCALETCSWEEQETRQDEEEGEEQEILHKESTRQKEDTEVINKKNDDQRGPLDAISDSFFGYLILDDSLSSPYRSKSCVNEIYEMDNTKKTVAQVNKEKSIERVLDEYFDDCTI